MPTSHEIHLTARPSGMPKESDFAVVAKPLAEPQAGEVLVRNIFLSVDPAMRPRLTAGQALNERMLGFALGRVEKSRNEDWPEGTLVMSRAGLTEAFVSDGKGFQKIESDPALPLSVNMHALGMTGFTAYGGLLDIGKLKDGEQVFVSTAAGAVGSVAAQIAKIKGCYVIGSTGSDEKAKWLREIGLDAVINYKREAITPALKAAAPKGIDVYFDNVGGEHLEAALRCMNTLGRIPVCGMISGYNADGTVAPVRNLANIIYGRVMLRGFVGTDFMQLMPKFREDMTAWLKAGKIQYQETIREGIAAAPGALIGLMKGENTGKMLVRVGS
jgi:NADPH-dependent curcumin reductase CurA